MRLLQNCHCARIFSLRKTKQRVQATISGMTRFIEDNIITPAKCILPDALDHAKLTLPADADCGLPKTQTHYRPSQHPIN